MKRKGDTVTIFTLRDPSGELIHKIRINAAEHDMSMNTWLLRLIEAATSGREEEGR